MWLQAFIPRPGPRTSVLIALGRACVNGSTWCSPAGNCERGRRSDWKRSKGQLGDSDMEWEPNPHHRPLHSER